MARKEKKYHFIYKTTNIITGKYYIGIHSTDNLEDGYMGSGKRIRYSINKYGKKNHLVEVLQFCENRKDLINKEKEIVNLKEISKENCINLNLGGSYVFERSHLDDVKKKISDSLKNKTYEELYGDNAQNEKNKRREAVLNHWNEMSDDERKKRCESNMGKFGKRINIETPIKCPNCGKVGRACLMKRWHFGNCTNLTGKKRRLSERHVEKIKEHHNKIKNNGGHKGTKVVKTDFEGNIIKTYNNITIAFEESKFNKSYKTFKRRIDSNKEINGFYYKKVII